MSSMKPQRQKAEPILKGPTVGDADLGSPGDAMGPIMDAVVSALPATPMHGAVGIASADNNYNLHMPSIAQIWKAVASSAQSC